MPFGISKPLGSSGSSSANTPFGVGRSLGRSLGRTGGLAKPPTATTPAAAKPMAAPKAPSDPMSAPAVAPKPSSPTAFGASMAAPPKPPAPPQPSTTPPAQAAPTATPPAPAPRAPMPQPAAPPAPKVAPPPAGRFDHLIAREQQALQQMQANGASPKAIATKQRYLRQLASSQSNTAKNYAYQGHSPEAIARWQQVEQPQHQQAATNYMAGSKPFGNPTSVPGATGPQAVPQGFEMPKIPTLKNPQLAISKPPPKPRGLGGSGSGPMKVVDARAEGIPTSYSSEVQRQGREYDKVTPTSIMPGGDNWSGLDLSHGNRPQTHARRPTTGRLSGSRPGGPPPAHKPSPAVAETERLLGEYNTNPALQLPPWLAKGASAYEFGKQAAYGDPEQGTKTGPYSADAAADVRMTDRRLAADRYNIDNNPGHAYANPFVLSGLDAPMAEYLSRPAAASRGSGYGAAVGSELAGGLAGAAVDLGLGGGGGPVGDAVAGGIQAIHGNVTNKAPVAREAFDRDVSPHRESPDPGIAGKNNPKGQKGGPYNAALAAQLVGADDQLAAMRQNRTTRPAHYLLNPFIRGPISELLTRYKRRMVAGMHDSWGGTLSALPTLGIAPAIMGGKDKQEAVRKDYQQRVAPYEADPPAAKPKSKPAKPKPKAKADKADKPKPKKLVKKSAAYDFGTDIAKHMKSKPKIVTRTQNEYRGADIKRGLAQAC